MKKKEIRKLTLHRETLKTLCDLEELRLEQAHGAATYTCRFSICPCVTRTCDGNC